MFTRTCSEVSASDVMRRGGCSVFHVALIADLVRGLFVQ